MAHVIGGYRVKNEFENQVLDELLNLPDTYWIAHNIEFPFGEVDAVVVGPTGVFVLDAKYWSGIVRIFDEDTVDDKGGWKQRVDKKILDHARKLASLFSKEFPGTWLYGQHRVEPCLVVPDPPQCRVEASMDVKVCHLREVKKYISTLPRWGRGRSARRLSTIAIDAIKKYIERKVLQLRPNRKPRLIEGCQIQGEALHNYEQPRVQVETKVWRAKDLNLDGEDVLIHHYDVRAVSEKQRPEYIRYIKRNARSLVRLDHPSTPRFLHQQEVIENKHFYMKSRPPKAVLSGKSLATLIEAWRNEGTPPSPAETAQIFLPLVEGMMHAHAQEVFHRGLSPSHIFYDPNIEPEDLKVAIIDFGTARIIGFGTITKNEWANEPYTAPELLATDRPQPDPDDRHAWQRTDVYSIGAILLEVLTLADLPYAIEQETFLETITPASLERVRGIPPEPQVQELLWDDHGFNLTRMLAYNPAQRYDSLHHVREVLQLLELIGG